MIIAGARRPVVPARMRTPPRAMRAVVPSFSLADTAVLPGELSGGSNTGAHPTSGGEMQFALVRRGSDHRWRRAPVSSFPLMAHRLMRPAAPRFLPPRLDHKGGARR